MIILDIGMPHLSGLEAAREFKRDHTEIQILVLTMHKSNEHLAHAMEVGVDGYLLKEDAFEDLITAIRTIRDGRQYISPLVTQHLWEAHVKRSRRESVDPEALTSREIEVLRVLAAGKSNREIAESLFISESTVRIHLGHIKRSCTLKQMSSWRDTPLNEVILP
jgi:DNA-binding NarL/FixJ family response regulator